METAAPVLPAAGAVAQEPAPGAGVTPPPAADSTPPAETKPDRVFTQAELDEILEKRLSKERRKREDIERRLKVTEELALKGREREAPPPQPQDGAEPTREQHPDMPYEDFLVLRAEWRAERKVEAKWKERETQDRERQAQEQQRSAGEEFRKRAKETAKDMPDFDEVVSGIGADDPVARISADPIANSDMPGKLLYHLAKNPEEAERIANLPMGQQAREIWKLEQKLAAPAEPATKPVKASKAPEPITPVGGKAAPSGDEMPDPATKPNEWMKWRQRQVAAKSKGARA